LAGRQGKQPQAAQRIASAREIAHLASQRYSFLESCRGALHIAFTLIDHAQVGQGSGFPAAVAGLARDGQ
jgi:hypothetical protein